ncbi:MAG: 7-cyano-7-deazaguanine synthase [bacterium]|nr:7-cyano-7-deazaguanine synthase [bacterium]
MVKALVLLSGGLDSMLAAKILMEQGIEVTGLSFKSNFFGTTKAKKVAEQLGIKLIEVDFSAEHFIMVKNPKHGYGKNMNPCIDCHAMMLKKAKEIMDREGFDFVATGEVLGERPMSQNAEALKTVEKESGLAGRLIRPLSAKLLAESGLEKSGKVIREKLLDISGRSRKPQLALVKKYGIKEYSSPGGGCLLTDPVFSEKLKKMFEYWPESDGLDAQLIKYGRMFWLKDQVGEYVLLVIGREKEDNEQLEKIAKPGDVLIKIDPLVAGPTSIIRIKNYELRIKNEIRETDVPEGLKLREFKLDEKKSEKEILEIATILTGYYATKSRGKKVKLEIQIKK